MKSKIAILGYKDFIDLTKAIIKNNNEKADVEVYQCLLEECLEILPQLESEQTDIIITGRANKQFLKKRTNIPIITFKITPIDIISAIKKALEYSDRIAIALANFEELEYNYSILADLLNIQIQFLSYNTQEELEDKIKDFSSAPGTVIGTTTSINYAKKYNLNNILIYSLKNTITEAIDYAIELIEFSRLEEKKSREFEAMLDSVSDGIIVTNEKSDITLINHSAQKLLSLGKNQIGQKIETIFTSKNQHIFNNNMLLKDELLDYNQNSFSINRVPIIVKDSKVGSVTILRDITEIQQLEQKYRSKVEAKGMTAKTHFYDIVYHTPIMEEIIAKAKRFANTDSTILLRGETGTGKELFAQSLHNESDRKNKPFVAINCGALPENLLESELFGYIDGAFTGANKKGKKGLFELAHNGTVFLDEINSISHYFQSRLLRVLQEKEVVRVGGDTVIPINIRVIAASNEDLLRLVREGKFRRDLFYRLNVLKINIPSLNDRIGDVIPLSEKFLLDYSPGLFSMLKPFLNDMGKILMQYHYTGNVRELYNILERFIILFDDLEMINRATVIQLLEECMDDNTDIQSQGEVTITIKENYKDSLAQAEKSILSRMYEIYNGNKSELAERIGLGRTTLYRKLKEFDIE